MWNKGLIKVIVLSVTDAIQGVAIVETIKFRIRR